MFTNTFLTRADSLTPPGPAQVTLPTGSVAPPPPAPPSGTPSVTQPSTPTDGTADNGDVFVFDGVFLGNGNSPEDFFELLGYQGVPDNGLRHIWVIGEPGFGSGSGGSFSQIIEINGPFIECRVDTHGGLICGDWP